jgi:CHASE3 domain sensor protein
MANSGQQPDRATVEANLLREADRVVASLEAAFAAAPDDPELRKQVERLVEQARRMRDRVAEAIAAAHAREEGTAPEHVEDVGKEHHA